MQNERARADRHRATVAARGATRVELTRTDRLRDQGFNATLRRVLVMVISIRGFVEACR
jgi:hypothetical protein